MYKISAKDVPHLVKAVRGLVDKRTTVPKVKNSDRNDEGNYKQEGLSDPATKGYITGSGGGAALSTI